MSFNPDNYRPERAQSEGYDTRDVPSGTYLVGVTWWDRISPRAVKVRAEVIAGPLKGASFFPMLATNVEEKKGSADGMYFWCKSFGIGGELDFSDACMQRKFLGRGGKLTIQRRVNGAYVNHDVKRALARGEITQNERELIAEWEEAFAARRSAAGGDDYGGGAGDFDDAPLDSFGDDDIPF